MKKLIRINQKYVRDLSKEVELLKPYILDLIKKKDKDRFFYFELIESFSWSIIRYEAEIEEYKMKLLKAK